MGESVKILLLRGAVPQDRSPSEIKYKNLGECNDIYSLLANELGDEKTEVLYWGKSRVAVYDPTYTDRWVKDLTYYVPDFKPDVILARGGFEETFPFLKRFPKAFKVYYGAGKRYLPKGFTDYNLTLQDSPEQLAKATKKFPTMHHVLWWKPVSHHFKPQNIKPKYDGVFVAIHPRDKRKNVKWVYKNLPKDFKLLQIGNTPDFKVPKNVKIVKALRKDMPRLLSKGKCLLAPYGPGDSAPRVFSEAVACGVPIVAFDDVRIWKEAYEGRVVWASKKDFFKKATQATKPTISTEAFSIERVSEYLKGVIHGYLKNG